MASSRAYPVQYEHELVLRNGPKVNVRPIRTDDTERWLAFVRRLNSHSKYLRFHNVIRDPGKVEALRFCTVDYVSSFALVAESPDKKDIIAITRYYRIAEGDNAEIALVTADEYKGKGIGTSLLKSLAAIAYEHGIKAFEADVLAGNDEAMEVFRGSGFSISTDLQDGVWRIRFAIAGGGGDSSQ